MAEPTRVKPYIDRLVIPFLDIYTTVFLIDTAEGWVLLDTATYSEDIDRYLVPAMAALGIGADGLKYVVISHNHRDHGGGLARFAELFPDTQICAGSDSCRERIPDRNVTVLSDGDMLCGVLRAVAMPGHTSDCIGLFDTRTKTLLSGDGLQLYGIYGSGNWGANISHITQHFALCDRLASWKIETVLAAHDYHPCGFRADGKDAVLRYLAECKNALLAIRDFAIQYASLDDGAVAELYNQTSGLPKIGKHIVTAVRRELV